MTPEDVLIEAIAAASQYGDSVYLRELECLKLRASIRRHGLAYMEPVKPAGDKDEARGH